jgi:predicted cupin superfamily sugar epimerase
MYRGHGHSPGTGSRLLFPEAGHIRYAAGREDEETKGRGLPSAMLTADQIRELLHLEPHPIEGGYFVETYKSAEKLSGDSLPAAHSGERALSTAIFYMLTPDTISALHRLPGDELFHFYLGDPVEMLQLKPDGTGEAILLGQSIASGMRLQHNVPGGVWQGCRLCPGGKFTLMGTTMAPGFDYQDYEVGQRKDLSAQFPKYAALIALLTR